MLRDRSNIRSHQAGFSVLEIMITLLLSSVALVFTFSDWSNQSDETIAEGTGQFLATIVKAAQDNVINNYYAYEQGQQVTGFADPLHPTQAELVGAKKLLASLPSITPSRDAVRVDITKTGCPGKTCTITSTACITKPLTFGGSVVRWDMIRAAIAVQNGQGGASWQGNGGNIRGAVLNVPNPLGNIEGIVCGSSFVDTGMYSAFVRMQDTRNPDLKGDLSVAGYIQPSSDPTKIAVVGQPCTGIPQGAMQADGTGRILSCQSGIWKSTDGGNTSITIAPLNNIVGGTTFAIPPCATGGTPWATYSAQLSSANVALIPPVNTVQYSVSQVGNSWVTLTEAVRPPNAAVTVNSDPSLLGTIPRGVFTAGCSYPG